MRWLDSITDSVDMTEQTLRDNEGQGSLACCSPWGYKESAKTQQLNNSNNQWLGLQTSIVGVTGSTPGQETRTASCEAPPKKKKEGSLTTDESIIKFVQRVKKHLCKLTKVYVKKCKIQTMKVAVGQNCKNLILLTGSKDTEKKTLLYFVSEIMQTLQMAY